MKTNRRIAKLFLVTFVCLTSELPLSDAALPELEGPYAVGLETFDLVDGSRGDRELKNVIWYPVDSEDTDGEPLRYFQHHAEGLWWYESPFIGGFTEAKPSQQGPFPVVALSHGSGGWPIQFAMMAESLASHGFVVVAPRHTGNAWGTPDNAGIGVQVRSEDMSFVLNQLQSRNQSAGDLIEGTLDLQSLAIGGYSFGVSTTVTNLNSPDDLPESPLAALFLDMNFGADLDVPAFHIGGSLGVYDQLKNATWSPDFQFLDIANTHHWSFGLNSCQYRSKLLEAGIASEDIDGVLGSDEWPGCSAGLTPLNDVQAISTQHAIAFLSEHLVDESEYKVQPVRTEGATTLWVRLDGKQSDLTSVIVTDPRDRTIGFDPSFGESINEIGPAVRHRGSNRRNQRFEFSDGALVPGEYSIHGLAYEDWTEEHLLEIFIGSSNSDSITTRSDKRLLFQRTLSPGEQFDSVKFVVPEHCDFDSDGRCDVADIDALIEAIRDGDTLSRFDLNVDDLVDEADLDVWVEQKNTYFGDANLDGEFNSQDFVIVFQTRGYEDGISGNSTWSSGDWNGDGEFDSADFIKAFQHGGYERGPRELHAVPETGISNVWVVAIAIFAGNIVRRLQFRRSGAGI